MNNSKFTYQKSGVNITAADKFVDFISNKTKQKKNNSKFKNIGGFGSISLKFTKNQNLWLVLMELVQK